MPNGCAQAAEILQAQGANPFRVGAYRKAADTVEQFPGSVRERFAAMGRPGLDALPAIGAGIAAAIAEMLETGRWTQLERLRGSLDPTTCFRRSLASAPSSRSEFTMRWASKRWKRWKLPATMAGSPKSQASGGAVRQRFALPWPRSSTVRRLRRCRAGVCRAEPLR